MKKFIIAMIAVVLGLSSCSKESKLLGSWELETIEALGETVDAKTAGLDLVLTFKDANVVEAKIGGYPETGSYEVKGKKLTIEDLGEFDFEVKNKTLTLKGNIELGDFGDEYCTLTFKKL